jgi:putative aldouronate transport system permease protein
MHTIQQGRYPSLHSLARAASRDRYLLLMALLPVVWYVVFCYVPMYGVLISFKDFSIGKGIMGSPWVGFKHFAQFFHSIYFIRLLRNTLLLSVLGLVVGFPVPIIFALMLNEFRDGPFKRVVQTISYLPHFVSLVVVVGMLVNFLSPSGGIVTTVLARMGIEPIAFMSTPAWFRPLYIGSDIWQNFGWDSIIYLAALSSVDPELYDAARVDGAGRWKQLLHVTLPSIAPTIVILLILSLGNLMSVGFEKIILMYNSSTYEVADVINTYVYRAGLLTARYSFGAAVGLFNSAINIVLLVIANSIARRVSAVSLW